MPSLLFEIGTEELPPGSIVGLHNQLKENIVNELHEKNIEVDPCDIQTFYTPRRIAITINNLPEKQALKSVEVKGPAKEKAFDSFGKPNQAAIGFAKKYSLNPKDLKIKEINRVEYLFANIEIGGESVIELFKFILSNSLKNTTGEKFMTWNNYDEKFARPIRWILAILNSEIIEFNYAGVKSSNYTYGHRFLSNKKIEIKNPTDYERLLELNYVIPSYEKRIEKIKELVKEGGSSLNAIEKQENDLYKFVANITEYPSSLICNFDKSFLSLPSIVIETVLEKHQKYFILKDKNNKELISKFLVISNSIELKNDKVKSQIIKGNEKVARARLNDAKFFFEEDKKRPFTYDGRIKDLEKITFQKDLGSIRDKVERLIEFSTYIYDSLFTKDEAISQKNNFISCRKPDVIEISKLCKLDLSTNLVFEMPELQGIIGAKYAKLNGYPENICKGIQGQYSDQSTLNIFLDNTSGIIVGIADRLDNLISLFSIGKIPTGSTDPFALRSQTLWVFSTIEALHEQYNVIFNISKTLNTFKDKFANQNLKTKITDEIIQKVKDFLIERLKLKYLSIYPGLHDLIDSVFAVGDPLSDIYKIRDNLILLTKKFSKPTEEDKSFLIAAKRLIRITENNINGSIDSNKLKLEEEKKLFNLFIQIEKETSKYKNNNEYYLALTNLTIPINHFFDKVLVNDPDPEVKEIRQSLLFIGKKLFEKICDFNKIIER